MYFVTVKILHLFRYLGILSLFTLRSLSILHGPNIDCGILKTNNDITYRQHDNATIN